MCKLGTFKANMSGRGECWWETLVRVLMSLFTDEGRVVPMVLTVALLSRAEWNIS